MMNKSAISTVRAPPGGSPTEARVCLVKPRGCFLINAAYTGHLIPSLLDMHVTTVRAVSAVPAPQIHLANPTSRFPRVAQLLHAMSKGAPVSVPAKAPGGKIGAQLRLEENIGGVRG